MAMSKVQFWITLVALVLALSLLAYRLLDGVADSALDLLFPAVVSVILLGLLRRNSMRRANRR